MTIPRYPCVHVPVGADDVDIASSILWDCGATGVEERDATTLDKSSGAEVTLSAEIADPGGRVDRLVLAYRQGTEAVFNRLDTRLVDGSYVATIPGSDVAPPLVEYYFEALDAQGLPIAARGDVAAPLRIAVPAPGSEGINVLEEWWFWTVIGAVVVGGVVTGVVLGTMPTGPAQPGTLIINVE